MHMAERSTVFDGTVMALRAALGVALSLALPTAAVAADVFACAELKAAVTEAGQGFASYKGAAKVETNVARTSAKIHLAKRSMTGATACHVVDVNLDEPKMRLRQTAYSCGFSGVSKLDKALRTQLTRCVAGEVDDPSDPDELTIWASRVSSGEGYRGIEVNAQANAVNGLTLLVRQSVCTNKGSGQACED
jgi:hypothetical protein